MKRKTEWVTIKLLKSLGFRGTVDKIVFEILLVCQLDGNNKSILFLEWDFFNELFTLNTRPAIIQDEVMEFNSSEQLTNFINSFRDKKKSKQIYKLKIKKK